VSPRALLLLAWLGASLSYLGCGFAPIGTLAHDMMLGPVSPVGRIHSVAVGGEEFRLDDSGRPIVTINPDGALLRPFSPDILNRFPLLPAQLGGPIFGGLRAFIRSMSLVTQTSSLVGRRLSEEQLSAVRPGLSAKEVLGVLGSPNRWIRRSGGSLMAYEAKIDDETSFYLGLPPGVSQFVPIPGVSNVRFRFNRIFRKKYHTLLFFDRDDRLVSISSTGGAEQELED